MFKVYVKVKDSEKIFFIKSQIRLKYGINFKSVQIVSKNQSIIPSFNTTLFYKLNVVPQPL